MLRAVGLVLLLFLASACSTTKSTLQETGEWLMISGAGAGAGSFVAGNVVTAVDDDASQVPYKIALGAGGAMLLAGATCLIIERATK